MPNWVFNNLTITGKEQDLKKFVEKAKTPHKTYWMDWKTNETKEEIDDRVISFWNFKKPENEQVYFAASDYKPEGYDQLSVEEKMAISMQFKSDGWYDWNIREWGTKWDASDPYLEDNSEKGEVRYSFSTAWSPAEGAYKAMVEQHPELSFEFHCEEEQGWGVRFVSEDGELIVAEEWDIPNSHTDYKERDNEDGCVCSWEEDPEEWYDDCPDKAEAVGKQVEQTEQVVEKFEDISEMIV